MREEKKKKKLLRKTFDPFSNPHSVTASILVTITTWRPIKHSLINIRTALVKMTICSGDQKRHIFRGEWLPAAYETTPIFLFFLLNIYSESTRACMCHLLRNLPGITCCKITLCPKISPSVTRVEFHTMHRRGIFIGSTKMISEWKREKYASTHISMPWTTCTYTLNHK